MSWSALEVKSLELGVVQRSCAASVYSFPEDFPLALKKEVTKGLKLCLSRSNKLFW